MGRLSSAKEEDEAAERHSHIPLPSKWPAGLFPAPPEFRARETVINGTTWYQPPPPHLHGCIDPHYHLPARYGNLPPLSYVGFYSRPRSQSGFPPLPYASVNYVSGRTSDFMSSYHHNDGTHHGNVPQGVILGYLCDSANGVMPSYHYNFGVMPHYPYDGSRWSYMPSAHCDITSPARPHCVMPSPGRTYGSMVTTQASQGAHVFDCSTRGVPFHAMQTLGKTFRHVVSWSGMRMPVIITSQAAAVVDWIQRQSGDLFGFDVEWKPNRFKGEDNMVALLQICGPCECLIVQLLYTDMIPTLLKEFLHNAKKHLGGVGIRQDVHKLEKDYNLACQGQVELGALASEKLHRYDLQRRGLKTLVDQVLGMTLVKTKKITMSNWEKEYLDVQQIEYACIDAWAAFVILQKLMTS